MAILVYRYSHTSLTYSRGIYFPQHLMNYITPTQICHDEHLFPLYLHFIVCFLDSLHQEILANISQYIWNVFLKKTKKNRGSNGDILVFSTVNDTLMANKNEKKKKKPAMVLFPDQLGDCVCFSLTHFELFYPAF